MAFPQLHLSAAQRRLERRWRLVMLVVALALLTILHVGYFHIKFIELAVRTNPSNPLHFSSRRFDEQLNVMDSQPSHSQNLLPKIPEESIPLQQDPGANDEELQRGQPTPITNTSRIALTTHASAVLLGLQEHNQTSIIESRPTSQTTREIPPAIQAKQRRDEATHPLDQHHKISNAALTYNGSANLRFDTLVFNHSPDPKFPPDFIKLEDVIDILQNTSFDTFSLRPLNFTLRTDMLGILIDAGRHYFNIWWLKRLMDVLHVLQFNFIHFRLTDDQAFAIQLESQPNLTWPARFRGKKKKVYSRKDIRHLIAYARDRGITIIPEINVPGHAGAWMGIPGLVVPCRDHACGVGYALPLNISHPNIREILTDVISEVIDIFENPPYLHLGGDEMELAKPCFDEVGAEIFDYNNFEGMLKWILRDVGYPEEQVIRWRETNFAQHTVPDQMRIKTKRRAGKINHWWHDTPGKTENVTAATPIIGSARLYMDVNFDESAWEVFLHSRKWWYLDDVFAQSAPVNMKGIIVGTFELDASFFHSRNVIGRLLAVTIGVSDMQINSGNQVHEEYAKWCKYVGFPDALCRRYGIPMEDWEIYRGRWQGKWSLWRQDLCDRFPNPVDNRVTIHRDTADTLSTRNQTKEEDLGNKTV